MLLVAVVCLLAALALLSFLRQGRRDDRTLGDKLPGPATLPLLGNALQFITKNPAEYLAMIHSFSVQYPNLYITWLFTVPTVHVTHPKYIEVFLGSSQNITKRQDYDFISQWLGTGLLTSTGSKWHRRRKQLTPAFHFKILEEFVPIFSEKARILVEKLREHQGKPEGVDIAPLVTLCALDIICETAMGTSIHAQEDSSSTYVSTIHEVNALLLRRMLSPWLYNETIFKLSPTGRNTRKCVAELHQFTNKVIRERKRELKEKKLQTEATETSAVFGSKKKTAFLDLLIGLSETEENFSDEDIREEVDTFMFEGHDTTAMGMSWAIFFLAANPQVQTRCVAELVEIFGSSDRDPDLADLKAMRYLERVIKESLRMRPSVWSVARNLDHPVKLDDYEIPAGTDINLDILNLHRNPEFYPDPEKFDPDRFLPENCVDRHPYAYIPFSAGPRNCIGQKFALLEEKAVLSTVLRNFELRAVDAERDKAMVPDLILRPQHGLTLRVAPRVMT